MPKCRKKRPNCNKIKYWSLFLIENLMALKLMHLSVQIISWRYYRHKINVCKILLQDSILLSNLYILYDIKKQKSTLLVGMASIWFVYVEISSIYTISC